FGGCHTERKRNSSRQDDQLPSPKMYPAQRITEHARLEQTLHRIVYTSKHGISNEREYDRIGVQWANTTERRVLCIEVEDGIKQLDGRCESHQHTHESEYDGDDDECFYDLIVVTEFFEFHGQVY